MSVLTVRQVHRRFLVLHVLRWLPAGLIIPVAVLLMLERGLTLPQIGLVTVAQGGLVLLLELPTGGLADTLGRRPVLVAAAVANLASLGLLVVADSLALMAAVWALQGIYRALDSGPLESWYVDSTLAADPRADIERGLSQGGAALGVAIAAGALLGGGLVAIGPLGPVSGLTLPVIMAVGVQAAALVTVVALLAEPGAGRQAARGRGALLDPVRATPRVVGEAVRLVRRSRIVLALVSVELFWGFGMVTFETLFPVRLAEVVGGAESAGALLGPTASAAWLANAAGAALVPLASRRLGVAPTAALLRVLQGVTVVGMALLAGPAGLVTAYLLCYVVHGASNPLHMALLHRQVDGPYRTSFISLNSMMAQSAGALGMVALTALAGATTVRVAMLVGAAVLVVAAPLYLPAWRAGRAVECSGRAVERADGGRSVQRDGGARQPAQIAEPLVEADRA